VIRDLQEIGVSVVILSGGEPMLRFDDVLRLVQSGDKNRSDFHIHTSGFGVTRERARALKDAGLTAAAVGLDDVNPKRQDALRGRGGAFEAAAAAVESFNREGVLTYLNLCLTPALIRSGDLWAYFEMARRLGVGLVEILEPRPCGGFQGRRVDGLISEEDRAAVAEFVRKGNHERRYRNHPLLYSIAAMEAPDRMGCMMGGLSHFSIDSAGNVIPCVFVPVSFGNILHEDLPAIFARMRHAVPAPIHAGCGSVLLADMFGDRTVLYDDHRGEWAERLAVRR
jgi:MoaA/NifB/PqqE/SkfB family radical SAM enzyme